MDDQLAALQLCSFMSFSRLQLGSSFLQLCELQLGTLPSWEEAACSFRSRLLSLSSFDEPNAAYPVTSFEPVELQHLSFELGERKLSSLELAE